MKAILLVLVLAFSNAALAATAHFTGRMNMIRSVSGRMVWNCLYEYSGHYFWREFPGNCPMQIEIR